MLKKPEEYGFQDIIHEKTDWVARITINRPQVYNAYRLISLQEICEVLHDILWDGSAGLVNKVVPYEKLDEA